MKSTHWKPSFLVCVIILLLAAGSKEAVIRMFGIHMTKMPISLQHAFDELDEKALLPYHVVRKDKIQNRDQLESLGTEQYLQWTLEDTEAAAGSPTRYCSVFITYYTGNPDMVPHVPDECYVGGGNVHLSSETSYVEVGLVSKAQKAETADVQVPPAKAAKTIAFQYALFGRTDTNLMKEEKFSVQYLFHANGQYCGSRTDTRWVLGSNWFSKYSYFCKVEWNFYGFDAFGRVYPDKQQTLEATGRLLSLLLPQLEQNHWPDWESVNSAELQN